MKVVKIGGPVYRIGVGGGSASSVEVNISQDTIRYTIIFSVLRALI